MNKKGLFMALSVLVLIFAMVMVAFYLKAQQQETPRIILTVGEWECINGSVYFLDEMEQENKKYINYGFKMWGHPRWKCAE